MSSRSNTITIAGQGIPDSTLAAEATELVLDTAPRLIFHHSRRVFLFGALQGRQRGIAFDQELLYIAAMFHDLGLNERFHHSGRRFEVDSAFEAQAFLQSHGVPADAVRRVWTAIALHTTPGVPEYMEPEVPLLTAGVEYDVLGLGYQDLADEVPEEIVQLHPRPGLKNAIVRAFYDGVRTKPDTTFGNVKADVIQHYEPGFQPTNFVETILHSDWPE
ncbi:HD domain-containing protein [Mycobacteroides franklinii]|uniref:HD domain-containing protein n=1 Tax=Mycobacteroides franklinii TaxID=948102 RepID=UPI0013E8A92B|nr:diguanylate cyclase [Mycobacteroides franklinii]